MSPTRKQNTEVPAATLPYLSEGNWSHKIVTKQFCRATTEPIPRVNSIKKNNMANNWGTNSNLAIASGYEMNARPVPLLMTERMSSTPRLCARFPRMPKIVMPEIKLVHVSNDVTISASLERQAERINSALPSRVRAQ